MFCMRSSRGRYCPCGPDVWSATVKASLTASSVNSKLLSSSPRPCISAQNRAPEWWATRAQISGDHPSDSRWWAPSIGWNPQDANCGAYPTSCNHAAAISVGRSAVGTVLASPGVLDTTPSVCLKRDGNGVNSFRDNSAAESTSGCILASSLMTNPRLSPRRLLGSKSQRELCALRHYLVHQTVESRRDIGRVLAGSRVRSSRAG